MSRGRYVSIYFVFSYLFLHCFSYSGLAVAWKQRETERGLMEFLMSWKTVWRNMASAAAGQTLGMLRNLERINQNIRRKNSSLYGNKKITGTDTQIYIYNNMNCIFTVILLTLMLLLFEITFSVVSQSNITVKSKCMTKQFVYLLKLNKHVKFIM